MMFKRFPFIHNHGDFVHLDALRDWLRGVVSLETFLKSKDDKAIVKDMHFTDERTTVDYIDTKDDTEKTETLCEYLTSYVYNKNNSSQFDKVDQITVIKDSRGENWVNMKEKATQEERLGVIRSNVPIAYDATDDYSTSPNRSAYLGINNRSINIYNDDTLKVYKKYWFANPIAYDVVDDNYASAKKVSYFSVNDNGIVLYDNNTFQKLKEYQFKDTVKTVSFSDFSPIKRCYNETTNINFLISKSKLELYAHGKQPIGGQAICSLSESITLNAGKYVSIGFELNDAIPENQPVLSNFINPVTSNGLYAKNVRCNTLNLENVNNHVVHTLSSVFSGGNDFPVSNGKILVTFFNPSENNVKINDFVITF